MLWTINSTHCLKEKGKGLPEGNFVPFILKMRIYQLNLSTMCESGGLHTSYPREAKRRLSVRYSSKIPQGGPLQLEPGGGYFAVLMN
ncbi:hypothetical protein DEO72_LG4g557 [Vigna unguiculata]|uniref:Uncharacterized protein n=1 Tax=Vigna unguiculata TaxID=3917 RepID=A0A4D6LLZ5_VIGUN|nr:hypothetical protein DEO72_LG4g557 [Vigna unguiculata]